MELNGTQAKKPFSGLFLYALSCGVTHKPRVCCRVFTATSVLMLLCAAEMSTLNVAAAMSLVE